MLLLVFGAVLVSCLEITADKTVETYEKFYTADSGYVPTPRGEHRHGTMGISTIAKFSMLSNTPTLFKVKRPGLTNDANTVSFESIHKPGSYLRYKNYKFHLENLMDSSLFEKDATFRERQGPQGRAYELLGRDNWFICHSEDSPYTMKAMIQKVGTKAFVDNCVYVPVRQQFVERKNIVKTVPSGGSKVVNSLPSTQSTDKCISLRFINKLGGPVRVVSSLKPEGYLVTANAFKLKTIFKHANHKQRHVIFYAENVQDRDDDVLLNAKNVFTVKPNYCGEGFQDVVLTSQPEETEMGGKTPPSNSQATEMTSAKNRLTNPVETPKAPIGEAAKPALKLGVNATEATNAVPQPPALINYLPKPPATSGDTPKPVETVSQLGTTTSSLNTEMGKPHTTNSAVTAYEIGVNNPPQMSNEKLRLTNNVKTDVFTEVPASAVATLNKPIQNRLSKFTPNAYSTLNTFLRHDNTGDHAPLQKQINNLDFLLDKRIQANPVGHFPTGTPLSTSGNDVTNGYEAWSSYGPCSVSCGVGYRRRTRICRPGSYCNGPSTETRACIKEQCSTNCIHTVGGSARPGSCCYFPFTFNGGQYYHCIVSPRSNDRLWCSTTPYFDEHKQWGYCPTFTKAPVRSVVQPAQPMQMRPAPQPYFGTSPVTSAYSSYYNSGTYNNPYRVYKDSSIPCNPVCYRTCVPVCPRNCCLSSRTDVPLTAYLGDNYGPTDKRSFITPYQGRYTRSISRRSNH